MKFGHFDDQNREYVITNPQTPWPWINYLGNDEFFSLISNTAGGYSFYKDMPDQYSFVVNTSHPLIKEINSKIELSIGEELKEVESKLADLNEKEKPLQEEKQKSKEYKLSDEKEKELEGILKEKEEVEKQIGDKVSEFSGEIQITRQLTDIAMLAHGILKGEALNKFVKRSIDLIDVETTIKKGKRKKTKN